MYIDKLTEQKQLTNKNMQSDLNSIQCQLPAVDSLYQVKSVIREIDGESNIEVVESDWSLRWTSPNLSSPITVSALELESGTNLYATTCNTEDLAAWDAVRTHFNMLADEETVETNRTPKPSSVLDCLWDITLDPAWNAHVDILDSAFDSADDSPYNRINRLTEALKCLAAYAFIRRTHRGLSPRDAALKAGLGNIWRERISQHTSNKYGNEYKFRYEGCMILMQEHLTLGGGSNDEQCLSIHFLWDSARSRLVIGHVGRHLTNTISHT
jgi:hypothetical protein